MIETIIQFNSEQYPFDSNENCDNLKFQALIQCQDSTGFINKKQKFQSFKQLNSQVCIKVLQIYQQRLIIHLIFEHVPFSLSEYIKKQVQDYRGDNILVYKKMILRNIAGWICQLAEFLSSAKILTKFRYKNMGVSSNSKNANKIKYYIGTQFQFTNYNYQELKKFYLIQRKNILKEIERQLQFGRRSDYLPNYIVKGSKLIFTDDLSDEKTTRKNSQNYQDQKQYHRTQHSVDFENNNKTYKKFGNFQNRPTKNNTKPKKHKYSCNFEEQKFDYEFQKCNQKLNKSFESENQTYSITQTKSMKIQVEHQKPSQKCRKNSLKFKITTFQQISIDKSLEQQNSEYENQRFSYPNNNSQNDYNIFSNMNKQPDYKKNYKQKVHQAKERAQALLSKYLKSKNKK